SPHRQRGISTSGLFWSEPVNISAPLQSGGRERSRNGGFDTRIRWFDGLREYLGDIAVAADQIFVKVPARHILRSRVGRPFVERMGIRPVYGGFGRDWKGNSIVALRGLRDLGRAAGFLCAEVVRGDT